MPISQEHSANKRDDAVLMELISKGDENAFAELVQKHLGKTIGMAMRIVRNQADAEDVAQDAFIRVWKHAEKWKSPKDGGAKFTTWFYRVVTNLCIDYTRKKKSVALDHIAEPQANETDSLTYMEQQNKYTILAEYVHALPKRQRIALTLYFYEEMSNKEAAEVMDISIKALESLLVRARRTLREKMKKKKDILSNG